MNTHDIQQLIDRYLAAETTPDEERQLALTLQQTAEAGQPMPDEWQAVLLMLGELTLGEALYDELLAQRKATTTSAQNTAIAMSTAKPKRRLWWAWAAAACIALVAGAALIRNQQPPSTSDGALVAQSKSPLPSPPRGGVLSSSEQVAMNAKDPSRSSKEVDIHASSEQVAMNAKAPSRSSKEVDTHASSEQVAMNAKALSQSSKEVDIHASSEQVAMNAPPRGGREGALDPFADFAADMRAIRTRGQQLEAYVAQLIEPNENF